MFNVIVVALFAVVGWQLYETVLAYRRATGTTWERLKAAFKDSATIAWMRINSLSISLGTAVSAIAEWAGAPGIKDAVAPYLEPKYLLAYTLVVLVGGEIARRRSLAS